MTWVSWVIGENPPQCWYWFVYCHLAAGWYSDESNFIVTSLCLQWITWLDGAWRPCGSCYLLRGLELFSCSGRRREPDPASRPGTLGLWERLLLPDKRLNDVSQCVEGDKLTRNKPFQGQPIIFCKWNRPLDIMQHNSLSSFFYSDGKKSSLCHDQNRMILSIILRILITYHVQHRLHYWDIILIFTCPVSKLMSMPFIANQ